MAFDGVASAAFDLMQGALELGIRERLDFSAFVADDVMVMFAALVEWLVAGGAGAEIDPLQVAVPAQLLECAVDTRDADPAAVVTEPVEDLLCGQAALLPAE